MKRIKKKRCRNCKILSIPDPKNHQSQKYCFKSECRKASKKSSQEKWLSKPENEDYFRGPENVERVQKWREKNPGYWKRTKKSDALQDPISAQLTENKGNKANSALQDFLQSQHPVIVGLIANFTGIALQDDIASILLRMEKYGQDILCSQPKIEGVADDCKIPDFKNQSPGSSKKLQLDRSPTGQRALH